MCKWFPKLLPKIYHFQKPVVEQQPKKLEEIALTEVLEYVDE